jgi:Reverse transcriptase (RNA-dependent DNA polymerase)
MENEDAARGGAAGHGNNNNNNRRPGRGGRGNRGQFRPPTTPSFEGRESRLKGFVFDVTKSSGDSDLFLRVKKEISIFVGATYLKYTGELTAAVDNLILDMPALPVAPGANATAIEVEIWKSDHKEYRERTRVYDDFKAGLCSIVLGQCTEALTSNIRSNNAFAAAQQDGIAMLMIIRDIMNNVEGHRNIADAICEMEETFYKMKKKKYESLQNYYDRFKSHVETMENAGCNFIHPGIANVVAVAVPRAAPNAADEAAAVERLKGVRFIRGAGDGYKNYLIELLNAKIGGVDHYPITLDSAFNILQRRHPEHPVPVIHDGVAFITAGDNGRTYANVRCNNCNLMGHYANHCPSAASGGTPADAAAPTTGDNEGNDTSFVLSQKDHKFSIPSTWILLDNESTVDVFCNDKLLRNIRTVNHRMYIHCNAGVRWTDQQADLPGYGTVWYSPDSIANILSLRNVTRRYRVVYDSHNGNQFVVTKEDGTKKIFVMSDLGLYYLDAAASLKARSESVATVLVNTVDQNKTKYTNAEVDRAQQARALQTKIGRPSTRDFIKIVTNNLLPNCPVTKRDIMIAEDIFGPDVGSLKGKTVRRPPHKVITDQLYTPLPPSIKDHYKDVTLCADLMYVNGIPFFITITRHIRFGTIEAIPNRKQATLLKAIHHVAAIYQRAGFRLRFMLMDNEFKCLDPALTAMGVTFNDVACGEHVPEIERYNRTVKERMRAALNSLPFTKLPSRLVIELASREVFWLNSFPAVNGISATLSPSTIVTGRTINYGRHCKFDFCEYVQTHEEHDNSMAPRTVGALALRPTGNIQGNYYFFSLSSSRLINRKSATPLPMPREVIDRVHSLARRDKANPGLVFLDRNQLPFADDSADSDDDDGDDDDDDDDYNDDDDDNDPYIPDDDGDDSESDADDDNPSDDDSAHSDTNDDDDDDNADHILPPTLEQGVISGQDECSSVEDHEDSSSDEDSSDEESSSSDEESNNDENKSSNDEESKTNEQSTIVEEETIIAAEMDAAYGQRNSTHNLRPRRQPSYSHLHTTVADQGVNQQTSQEEGVDEDKPLATPQMSMKRGLKVFGGDGMKAIGSEMQQLHDRKVMKAKCKKELTPEQRRDALAYLMFLKRKRCGKVKARGCADGRKQRAWTAKEEATSPTIATEAVFLTAVIDALENRDVAIVDVPGAFMQADMDELVHVRFTGTMVDLLLEIDTDMYEPYITYEGKEKVLYVELLKALYGTMRAARLFWEKLSRKLLDEGFEANPYDTCVVNKMINGKQCTIGWHVDDLKISHVDSKVVDQVIDMLEDEFGKEAPMNKSRGKVHDYLGMILDFSKPGEITVDMVDYVKTILAEMPDDMEGSAKTPAPSHLFSVNEDNPILLEADKADVFHRMVMQLLYLCQRGRPDVRTAVSYLCRRTSAPDIDDYKKLTRVIRYLQSTLDLKLRLSADGSGIIQWWVDAAYGVHFDMKGQTGGTMSMGKGSVYSFAAAQKLVARSSTEAEVIGVDDVMPQMMWTGHFLKAQGVLVVDTILYQDNKSSILLEKNGRASSGKRTRHINIRYYFVADRVASGDLRIEHCPTEDMVADYFTKPLQGTPFYKLRDLVMNIDSSSPYHSSQRSVLKNDCPECPGNDRPGNLGCPEYPGNDRPANLGDTGRRTYRDVLVASNATSTAKK